MGMGFPMGMGMGRNGKRPVWEWEWITWADVEVPRAAVVRHRSDARLQVSVSVGLQLRVAGFGGGGVGGRGGYRRRSLLRPLLDAVGVGGGGPRFPRVAGSSGLQLAVVVSGLRGGSRRRCLAAVHVIRRRQQRSVLVTLLGDLRTTQL